MKPLKKHPKQQRMEDMQIPGMKPRKKLKKEPDGWSFSSSSFTTGKCYFHPTRPAVVMSGKLEANLCQECLSVRLRSADFDKQFEKEKVIWEGREYLRSISDPHHGRHVFMVLVLIVAVVIAVVVL